MFFFLSKALWLAADPVTLLLFGALAGACAAWWGRRFGSALALACAAALLVAGLSPVGVLLVRPLEQRFPEPPDDMPPPYGLIVLGGNAFRLTEAAILARRYPEAKVIYTGGSGSLIATESTAAEEARQLLVDLGTDPARIVTEEKSRNTKENASLTAALMKPTPDQTWLLMTSAFHMPRSMGLFRKAGFLVTAFPIGYYSMGGAFDFPFNRGSANGLLLFDIAVHEWIGLLVYYATGKIDDVFPAP